MSASKQIQFVKGSVILIISNIVLKGINFFLLPLYTEYLNPTALGISDTITSFTAIIFPILVMGLDSAFSAFYFDNRTKQHQKGVFNTVWITLFIASIIPVILAICSKEISLLLFGNKEYSLLVGIALITVSMNLWYLPFSLYIRMQNKMLVFAIINITASLSMIICNVIFLSVFRIGVYSLILSSMIIQLVQLIMYILLGKVRVSPSFCDKVLLKQMMRYAIPLVPAAVATWVLNMSNRYIINFYCGEWDVGLYGIAARFGSVVALFTNGIYTAYTTYAYDKKDDEDAKKQYKRILNAIVFATLMICSTVSIFGKEAVWIMAEKSYIDSYLMMAPILFSQLLYGVNTIIGYAIGFAKKSHYIFISTAMGAMVNLILDIIFIPMFGAVAAAYALCAGFLTMVIVTYIFAQRLYYINYNIIKISMTTIVMFVLSVVLQNFSLILKLCIWIISALWILIMYKSAVKDYLVLIKRVLLRKL